MIKELLSTALLAVSLNTTPRRAVSSDVSFNGTISIDITDQTGNPRPYADIQTASVTARSVTPNEVNETTYYWANRQEDPSLSLQWGYHDMSNDVFHLDLLFYFDSQSVAQSFLDGAYTYITCLNGYVEDGQVYNDGRWDIAAVYYTYDIPSYESLGDTLTIAFPNLTTYYVTKNLTNCRMAGNTDYGVPDTFTTNTLANPYTIWVVANDGYFFKRDGSSFSFSSGVVVSNVDYGANPQGQNVIYTEQMFITFSLPASDVTINVTANPITLADANGLYNQGYQDAKAIYENTNQFAWLKNIWSGMAGFFAIEILPNISLGFLAFAPLLVVAIIAIVRILKHD